MATGNEHVVITQKTFPVSMKVSNSAAIEKGSLLTGSDPNTVAQCTTARANVVGVLMTEKIANDGNTQASVLSGPGDELKAVASGSISFNDALISAIDANANGNRLASAVGLTLTELSGSTIVGYSLETASAGDTFKYVLNITKYPGIGA